MARRVRLIELALERLRWLPLPAAGPVVIVILAGFRLWAIERSGGEPRPWLTMRVVVGRALRSQTPLLGEELRFVIFRPYWNIPPAIARNETLPAARRDPGYLAAQDMELVAGDRDDSPVVPATAENLARVGPGGLRIRQRPGPRNSLGRVKFVFPNNANVYLHDTPARGLFARDRRDLSHGCVRVAEPVALAEWVLRGVPGWTRERIEKAMTAGPPQQVNLPVPIPVLLGILPLQSHRHAEFMHNEVPGISVPQELRDRLRDAGADAQAEGVRHARQLLNVARGRFAGVYLMPSFGRYENVIDVLKDSA
jgi:murein L,D-transpeptidase YcbB/YkuD